MASKQRLFKSFLVAATAAYVTAVSTLAGAATQISEQEAYEIGVETYTYTYPLVTMDITRRQMTNVERLGVLPTRMPMNTLLQMRSYVAGENKDVVRPNFDTLYSIVWFDLTREPMILSVPGSQGRYYVLGMLDMWTDVFATPGSRTTGTSAGQFAFVAPGWKGVLPANVQKIEAPTPYVWMIGRTQTNGPKDYGNVNRFQDGMRITPLSQWGKPSAPVVDNAVDPSLDMKTPPLRQVNGMPAAAYYHYAAELMKRHPAHATDQAILARMKRIGFEAGKSFDLGNANPVVRKALERAAPDALQLITAKVRSIVLPVNGWLSSTENIGTYGNSYLKRAVITLAGLGALPPEDAIYPTTYADADNKPLSGAAKYTLHFNKDELPPARAFWSVTLYDNEGFQVPNPLKRYAIGDRDELKYETDGSLTLYVQNESPGKERELNWLPAPKGPFNLTMRIYDVKPAALNGSWAPPAVRRVE